MKPLRVIINALLLLDGSSGGVQQFTTSLIHALGRLDDGPEEYVVVSPAENHNWLSANLGPNQRHVTSPETSSLGQSFRRALKPFKDVAAAGHLALKALGLDAGLIRIPESHGFYESLEGDLIHFPFQGYCRTSLPSIYNPHDLLHLHYPQFLPLAEVVYREEIYRSGCNGSTVVVESEWVRNDIANRYGLNGEKMKLVLLGSPTELYSDISKETLNKVKELFGLPEFFALYPAQTWPHKNHLRLIEAVKMLRDSRGLNLKVICVGHRNAHWPIIRKRIKALGLDDLFIFPGFVKERELRALYRLARFVIFPSLFEGGGFPVLEAFSEGAPLACSATTSLPEYAGQAAMFFDPTSVESIAGAMEKMTIDDNLRSMLRERGRERIRLFTWETTAKSFRALYRQTAGRPLSAEDRHLLAAMDRE